MTRSGKILTRIFLALLLLGGIVAALFVVAPDARADGIYSQREIAYANNSYATICKFVGNFATINTIGVLMTAIQDDGGFLPDDAVDVINFAVVAHCPNMNQILLDIGQAARNRSNNSYA